jgi:anti-anti-sigma factor
VPGCQAVGRHQGESLEVAVVGELDMTAALKLETAFEDLLAADDIHRLVFDLVDLTLIDSAGLGALLAIRDRRHGLGIEMVLTNRLHPARRILKSSRVSRSLAVAMSKALAVASKVPVAVDWLGFARWSITACQVPVPAHRRRDHTYPGAEPPPISIGTAVREGRPRLLQLCPPDRDPPVGQSPSVAG